MLLIQTAAGIIPYIKKLNPKCKLIFRSHIEIRSDLVSTPETEQNHVWTYLSQYVLQTDLFISHPVSSFIPPNIPSPKVLLMPASTDPIDGLNKPLSVETIEYYQAVFNRISVDTTGRAIDFTRPYLVQIARFDPSKGIPDVIKAYELFRRKLKEKGVSREATPQLVLAGHGSVDDPDGNIIFEQVLEMLGEERYRWVLEDICVARYVYISPSLKLSHLYIQPFLFTFPSLPPSDQLLNTLLTSALIALQLSIREGFEIKVTESIAKGVPVIAYAAGGIPHQIQHSRTGFLVPVGDIDQVVEYLVLLCSDRERYEGMSRCGRECVGEEYFTVSCLEITVFVVGSG